MSKLTFRQENFCKEYIKNGGNATKAYRDAGYSYKNMKEETVKNNAYMLLNKRDIKATIDKLKEPLQKKFDITLEKLINELELAKQFALSEDRKDLNNYIKAIQEQGKLAGLYIQKQQVEIDGKANINVEIIKSK